MIMKDKQIRQNAEAYSNGIDGSMCYPKINNTAYDAFIAGAHSRDEEITRLSAEIEDDNYVISKLREELNKLRNPWKNASKQLPPEDKEGSNLSIDCLVMAGDGNSFFYVIAWYDYSGKCWYEKYDFDQTHLDGNKVFYWVELPKCNHIETEGGNK